MKNSSLPQLILGGVIAKRLQGSGHAGIVVKDAEGFGDYAENLDEITELADKPTDKTGFARRFNGLDKNILELFEQTKDAFIEVDEDKARAAYGYEKTIAKGCDKILEQLAHSKLSVSQTVCFTPITRHFKRIVAHLVNIATSVVLPLSVLDCSDERKAND